MFTQQPRWGKAQQKTKKKQQINLAVSHKNSGRSLAIHSTIHALTFYSGVSWPRVAGKRHKLKKL